MSERVSSGSFDLNDFLGGGYEKDVISMIAGPPASGKSNLCILAACSRVRENGKVVFVDTEGGFSVERVKQIVGGGYEKILESIFLLEPTSFKEQKECFKKLLDNVRNEHLDLIVIDGMAMLYRLELMDAVKSGEEDKIREVNAEVARQMRILSEISRKQKIPILITNQVYSKFSENGFRDDREVNLVGGNLLRYWSKCIIELKNDYHKRKAVLLKHRSLPVKEMGFEIKEKGVFRKRWI
tara:strand:+ start:57779 stop:58498 length:720 start_codon:yes stop_codon:yes gene_type:complete